MNVLGWDIGGANLKVSDGRLRSIERTFPLWKQPERLGEALRELAVQFEPAAGWAITMTGELADCFATKREGVERILREVRAAAGNITVAVWTTAGEFVDVEEATEWPLLTAASNWLALATWAGRMVPEGSAILVDTGSTTTDIIPLVNGFPNPAGRTDVERLVSGELVYTGWRRTPVAAMADAVVYRNERCPLAAELFATAHDVHLLLGHVAESDECDTANGRAATRAEAHDRLARMLCCDRDEVSREDAEAIAGQLTHGQVQLLVDAIQKVASGLPGVLSAVLVSGSGEFLAKAALERAGILSGHGERHSLSDCLGREHATAACAFAVSRLAVERVMS